NGSVSCWGNNESGQLGDATQMNRLSPTPVSRLSGVGEVTGGQGHSCARTEPDGQVYCWGSNSSGELGDGTALGRLTPVQIPGLMGVGQIVASFHFTCARTWRDSAVRCWGGNSSGVLGDDTITESLSPRQIPGLPSVAEIVAGDSHLCARISG